MTFFSLLFALIAEQYKPVEKNHWVERITHGWLDCIDKNIDTGAERSGRLACLAALIATGPLSLILKAISFAFSKAEL